MGSKSEPQKFSDPGAYNADPNAFPAFDTSGMSNSAIARANEQGANQIAQAKAQAAGSGGGRSSALQNAVGQIQSGLGANAQNVLSQNAKYSFEKQLENMKDKNQYQLGAAGLLNQGYGLNSQANQANAQANAQNLASIAALIAML